MEQITRTVVLSDAGAALTDKQTLVLGVKGEYGTRNLIIQTQGQWASMDSIKAVFTNANNDPVAVVLDSETNQIEVPYECTQSADTFNSYIVFVGYGTGVYKPSTRLPYKVIGTGYTGGVNEPDPTPSVYAQYVAAVKGYRDEAVAAKTAAETAKTGADAAKTAAETAQGTAVSAKDTAVSAATAAAADKTAADSAKAGAESAKDSAVAAKTAAEAAQSAAEAAKTGADTAKVAAESAASSANSYKADAQGYANTASTKATEAAASATAAAGSASQAASTVAGIEQKGAQQVALVTAEGNTQVARVKAAGTAEYNKIQQELPTINSKISALETTMPTKADKTALAKTDRSLKALWELNEGQTYQFETDDDAGDKTVPTGAKLCSALSISGMSRKGYQLIPSTFAWCTETTSTARYTVNGNSVTNEAGDTRSWANIISADRITLTAGTYTIHGDGNIRFQVGGTSQIAASSVNTLTFTITEQTDIGLKMLSQDNTYPVTGTNIILEKGTLPHDYEPYTDELIDAPVDTVEIVGRNRFNANNAKYLKAYYLGDKWNFWGGETELTVREAKMTDMTTGAWYSLLIDVEGLSSVTTSGFDNAGGINTGIFDSSFNCLFKTTSIYNNRSWALSAYPSAKWVVIGIHYPSTKITGTEMAEIGSSANDFAPYTESTITIPSAVTSLDGYGCGISAECANEWDVENGKYRKAVRKLVLNGTESWAPGTKGFYCTNYTCKPAPSNTENGDILCAKYETNTWGNVLDREIAGVCISSTGRIGVNDGVNFGSANLQNFKNGLIATPITVYVGLADGDITETSVTAEIEPFTVEAGGTIAYNYTNKSTYPIDVPNTVEYTVKLSEVAE